MFEKLSIKNFKSISDEQELRLAPITLIYGPNSSGKSTLIQSLLLIQQTMLKPNITGGLVTNGINLKLGNFPVIVNKHESDKDIEFKVEYFVKERLRGRNEIFHKKYKLNFSFVNNSDYSFSYLKRYQYVNEMDNNNKKIIIDNVFLNQLSTKNILKLKKKEAEEMALSFKFYEDHNYFFENVIKDNKLPLSVIKSLITKPLYKSTLNHSVPSSTVL